MSWRTTAMNVRYNPEITLGTLLQIGTILSAVFSAYIALAITDAKHDAKLAQHEVDILQIRADIKNTQVDIKEGLKEVGKDIKGVDNKITQILIDRANDKAKPR